MLVAIHAVDYDAVGLGDFGHPDGYVERQVRRWGEQWERSKTRELPASTSSRAGCAPRCPSRRRPRSCTATTASTTRCSRPTIPGTIVAVLDWEMATLGDPLADLGLFLLYWERDEAQTGNVGATISPEAGFLTRDEVVERYAKQSGRDVSQLDFYEALAAYKLAIILEGIHARYLMGKTVGDGFDHIGAMVEVMVHGRARPGVELVDSRAPRLNRPVFEGRQLMGVLDGVKVLEVAEHGFVPSAAAILADWGADVVKVERPTGDPLRHITQLGSSPTPATSTSSSSSSTATSAASRSTCATTTGRAALDALDRVGRRVHHELPAVGAREAAARPRRHLGGEPALRLRDRLGSGSRRARRRPGRLRRGVVLGARRARATCSRQKGAPLVHAARRARRRAERRVPRGRRRGRARSSASAPASRRSSTCRCSAPRCGRCRRPRADDDPAASSRQAARRGQGAQWHRARRLVPHRRRALAEPQHARPGTALGTDVPRARARRPASTIPSTRPPRQRAERVAELHADLRRSDRLAPARRPEGAAGRGGHDLVDDRRRRSR